MPLPLLFLVIVTVSESISAMPSKTAARGFRTPRFLALLFAAGMVGVALPLLLGMGLHRIVVWLTGEGR